MHSSPYNTVFLSKLKSQGVKSLKFVSGSIDSAQIRDDNPSSTDTTTKLNLAMYNRGIFVEHWA